MSHTLSTLETDLKNKIALAVVFRPCHQYRRMLVSDLQTAKKKYKNEKIVSSLISHLNQKTHKSPKTRTRNKFALIFSALCHALFFLHVHVSDETAVLAFSALMSGNIHFVLRQLNSFLICGLYSVSYFVMDGSLTF